MFGPSLGLGVSTGLEGAAAVWPAPGPPTVAKTPPPFEELADGLLPPKPPLGEAEAVAVTAVPPATPLAAADEGVDEPSVTTLLGVAPDAPQLP